MRCTGFKRGRISSARIAATMVIGALVFAMVASSGCSSSATANAPVQSFSVAVEQIQHTTKLTIYNYSASSRSVTLSENDSNLLLIKRCLAESSLQRTTGKFATVVDNGVTTTVQVTIPYAIGYILVFELNDGSQIRFNSGTSIWFETDKAIYEGSFSADLQALLLSLFETIA
ncbi:MAG: hypothetical protein FWF18_01370 [Dehalococcoidia bacterium]|nr:hypothetical protein [Dehalococcoidia bacterium]